MPDDGINHVNPKLLWALKLAALGFRIFPLRVGAKEPVAGRSWADLATTDAATIRGWFASGTVNYAVNPDEHHVVIDVDTKKGKHGDTALSALEKDCAFDEQISAMTFRVRTPSGGLHYYLIAPFGISNSHHFPAGIDVRGPGGYVVGPACDLVAGQCDPKDTPGAYVVENDGEMMQTPAYVLNLLKRQGEKAEHVADPIFDDLDNANAIASATTYLKNRRPAIETSEGDKHTLVTAMALMDFGLSERKTLELMVEPIIKIKNELVSWNDTCEPPWDINELAKKVENAAAYRQTRPGSKGSDAGALDEAMARALAAAGVDPDAPPPPSKWAAAYYNGNAIFTRNKRRESVIPGVLPAQGLAALIARRGSGKTVIMVDMALRIAHAADMEWHGHPLSKGMHVVYVCGEDDTGAEEMVRAWCLEHEITELPERFHFFERTMDLLNAQDCEEFTHFVLSKIGSGRAVTFFDTWQRATTSAAQSDDKEMQRAWGHAEAIVRSFRGPGVVACHPPKDDKREMTIMGSSVLENSSEALWSLEKKASHRRFEVTRLKGGREGLWIGFEIKVVGLVTTDTTGESVPETDEFGRQRTGAVAVKVAGEEGEQVLTESTVGIERQTYAVVINELDHDRQDRSHDWHSTNNLSLGEVADRLAKLPEVAKEHDKLGPTPRAVWAHGLVVKLSESARVTTFTSKAFGERLHELFRNQINGVQIDADNVVKLKERGGKRRFFTEPNMMSKQLDIEPK